MFIGGATRVNEYVFPVWSQKIQLKNTTTRFEKNIYKVYRDGGVLYEAQIYCYCPDFTGPNISTYISEVDEPLDMFMYNIDLVTDIHYNLRKLELVKKLIGNKVEMVLEDRAGIGTGYFDVNVFCFWDYNKALIKQLLKLKKNSEEYKAVEFALYKAHFYSSSSVDQLVYPAKYNWRRLAKNP